MKLVLYDDSPGTSPGRYLRGILRGDEVVSIEQAVGHLAADSPQQRMQVVIDSFESLRPELERLAAAGPSVPLATVRLRPPLPRPSKILACIGNYWEHMQREARPLNMFLKSPDAVIGPGDTVVLPDFRGDRGLPPRGGARHRHQGPRQGRQRGGLRRRHLRLHLLHRRLSSRRGPAHLARRELDGQVLRHLRTHGPLHRHRRRGA